ncbi:MAG: hypothetical protein V3575_04340, partial [Candidatus Absconditabacteria bacterium]
IINNSVGSRIFKNAFFDDGKGQLVDVLDDGDLSCAYFVSSILNILGIINSVHCTVKGTLQAMEKNGWTKNEFKSIEKVSIGSIILWENNFGKDGSHYHIGFYIGDNLAVSNCSSQKAICKHPVDYNGEAKVIGIYYHSLLD